MQLQGGSGSVGTQGSRVTPTPMVQTPVGTVSGNQHSRSSSQASQVSQSSPPQTLPAHMLPVPSVDPNISDLQAQDSPNDKESQDSNVP